MVVVVDAGKGLVGIGFVATSADQKREQSINRYL